MKKKQATKKPRTIGGDAGEYIGTVIKSAIDEGRKHVDQEALKRVFAKLTAAYNWRAQAAAAKQ